MKPITTMDPPHRGMNVESLLTEDGLDCSLLTLSPGGEPAKVEAKDAGEELLFVVEGEATVRFPNLTTVVNQHRVLHIPAGKPHAVSTQPGAIILRVKLPGHGASDAVIHSFS